jgi:PAS domain S-box-containing protein
MRQSFFPFGWRKNFGSRLSEPIGNRRFSPAERIPSLCTRPCLSLRPRPARDYASAAIQARKPKRARAIRLRCGRSFGQEREDRTKRSRRMQAAYLQIVIMLHAAFAGVFFFLHRQSPLRFAWLIGISWVFEGCRAAILLHVGGGGGPWSDPWYCISDVLGFFATWYLLLGGAALVEVRLPRWLAAGYFGMGLPFVVFSRYGMPAALETLFGVGPTTASYSCHVAYVFAMFLPVGAARLAMVVWLYQFWKKTRLSGSLIACIFCVPFAIVAISIPFQDLFSYSPGWVTLLWCMRVLGFSIGLVILMLNIQQAAVARSESRLSAAQSLARIGSWELDAVKGDAIWSTEMYRLYGRDPRAGVMTYNEFVQMIHPADRAAFQESEAVAVRERRPSLHEFRIVRPDGSVGWIQGRNTPQFGNSGQLLRVLGVEQDITERKRAESRRNLQHAVTRVLAEADTLEPTLRKILEIITPGLDSVYGGFWMVERSTRRLRCVELWHAADDRLAEFAGLSRSNHDGAGRGLPGRVLAEGRAIFVSEEESLESDVDPRREAALRAGLKRGSAFPIMLRGEIFGVVEFFGVESQPPDSELATLFADLGTQIGQFIERQRLEEQYRQSQKMEAVGTLAGGIAHDFNNILTAINGYCELALMDAEGNPAMQENLTAVQAAARRAVDLVRQIMAFSRQQGQKRSQLQIQVIVEEALNLLRATIPTTIEIKTTFGSGVHAVLADPTSIHQIIVNLGTNAWHSMRDRSGRLDIALGNIRVDADLARLHPTLTPGSYVRLSMSDTGHGMDEATVSRIFEPFFTTKAPGEGTGLGLAVVHGIMKAHDGAILVYSRPGEGTKFDLYFPAYSGEGEADTAPQAAEVPRGSGERILYVDDEKPLGLMGKKILEHLGYKVDIYSEAVAAMNAVRVQPKAFDLVITDLTMPVMTGLELAQEILRIRSDLPIILTSGYTATLNAKRLHAMGIAEVLMKPHSFDSLGATVHRVFVRESASRPISEPRGTALTARPALVRDGK